MTYCCASDVDTTAEGNISADPKLLTDGTYGIELSSPCAGTGTNLEWMAEASDITGNPRVWTDGTVSMGAVEPQGRFSGVAVDFAAVGGLTVGRAPFTTSFEPSLIGAGDTVAYLSRRAAVRGLRIVTSTARGWGFPITARRRRF